MAQKVVLYSRNNCWPCKKTKKLLTELEIIFEEINLDERTDLMDYVKNELGFSATPVVVTDYDKWAGFQPDKIRAIKK